MAYIVIDKRDERVRKIRIQVGDEWVAHDFGRPVERDYARARVLSIVEALIPAIVETLPEGGDAKLAPCASKGGAVAKPIARKAKS